MSKIAIVLDHDIILRNFLETGAFSEIFKKHSVDLIFPKNHNRITNTYIGKLKSHYINIDEKRSYKIRLLYHYQKAATLHRRKNIKDRNYKEKKIKKIIGKKKFFFLNIVSKIKLFFLFKLIYKYFFIKKNLMFFEFLDKEKYDYIIHPTVLEGLFIYDLIEYKEKTLKSKIIFLMNSWDNPSNKALIDDFPHLIGVWGEQTKNHCVDLLKIPKENIIVTGSAQLSMYKDFKINFKKDEKKTLCFAGSSLGLNENQHLNIIDKIIENKKLNIKVIYKPHPWKSFHKNEQLFEEKNFSNVKIDALSIQNYEARYEGKKFELNLMKNQNTLETLRKIDFLITPLSTIMLEAAICGIPFALYIPNDISELNKNFIGHQHHLIYQEFIQKMEAPVFSNINDYEKIFKEKIKKNKDYNFRRELQIKSKYFCDLSMSYKFKLLEILNV